MLTRSLSVLRIEGCSACGPTRCCRRTITSVALLPRLLAAEHHNVRRTSVWGTYDVPWCPIPRGPVGHRCRLSCDSLVDLDDGMQQVTCRSGSARRCSPRTLDRDLSTVRRNRAMVASP